MRKTTTVTVRLTDEEYEVLRRLCALRQTSQTGYLTHLATSQAKKELTKIHRGDPKTARKIAAVLSDLQSDPSLGDLLHGDLKGRRKIRVGDYRIVYSVEKTRLIIFILRIAHRKEVYR